MFHWAKCMYGVLTDKAARASPQWDATSTSSSSRKPVRLANMFLRFLTVAKYSKYRNKYRQPPPCARHLGYNKPNSSHGRHCNLPFSCSYITLTSTRTTRRNSIAASKYISHP